MKIFKQSYVGMKPKEQDDIAPLAFLVPFEDNAAGAKRMDSVDNWVDGRYYDKYPTPVPDVLTQEQADVIYRLIKRKEAGARVTRYRGYSISRIDKKSIVGSMEYERAGWRWPAGFAEHYVRDHRVSPSEQFLKFIGYWDKEDREKKTRPGTVFDNAPMRGFKIIGFAERWSTDNKTARILDPRGFMLEIYIPNLIALIQDNTIINGEIQEQLVWAREGSNNALISIRSEDYKTAWFEGADVVPVPGDIVRDGKGIEYLYLGKRSFDFVGRKRHEVPPPPPPPGTTHRYYAHQRHYKEGAEVRLASKPMHLYVYANVPKGQEYWYNKEEIVVRAGPMKVEAIVGHDKNLDLTSPRKVGYDLMYHNADGTKWQKEGYGPNGEEFFSALRVEIHG